MARILSASVALVLLALPTWASNWPGWRGPEGNGHSPDKDVPLRTAMNEVLRDNYVEDCQRAVDKWNRTLDKNGAAPGLRFALPHRRFHRHQGIYSGAAFDVAGNPISAGEFEQRKGEWLPSSSDIEYIESLMKAVHEPGKIANWIAPPTRGINGQPFEFEYVRG